LNFGTGSLLAVPTIGRLLFEAEKFKRTATRFRQEISRASAPKWPRESASSCFGKKFDARLARGRLWGPTLADGQIQDASGGFVGGFAYVLEHHAEPEREHDRIGEQTDKAHCGGLDELVHVGAPCAFARFGDLQATSLRPNP
jgi:hypothetical protein